MTNNMSTSVHRGRRGGLTWAAIDHVVVVVEDLASGAARWWSRAGVVVERGGRHPGGTENALAVMRQQFYLELIAVHDPASSNTWTRAAAATRGPLAWALSVDDLDTAVTAVRRSGVPATDPVDGSRTCSDGRVVNWRSSFLGDAPGDAGWPFLIEWPVPGPDRLGIGVTSNHLVTGLQVAVPDADRAQRVLCGDLALQPVPDQARCLTDGVVRLELIASRGGHGPRGLVVRGLDAAQDVDGLRLHAEDDASGSPPLVPATASAITTTETGVHTCAQ